MEVIAKKALMLQQSQDSDESLQMIESDQCGVGKWEAVSTKKKKKLLFERRSYHQETSCDLANLMNTSLSLSLSNKYPIKRKNEIKEASLALQSLLYCVHCSTTSILLRSFHYPQSWHVASQIPGSQELEIKKVTYESQGLQHPTLPTFYCDKVR